MSFSDWAISTLLSTAITGALLAGLVALLKTSLKERITNAIKSEYDKELESYKNKLKSESDSYLVKLTAELELKSAERHIKLTRTFENQADAIALVYEKLVTLLKRSDEYHNLELSAVMSVRTSKLEEFKLAYFDLIKCHSIKKLYLPKSTHQKFSDLMLKLTAMSIVKAFNDISRMREGLTQLKAGEISTKDWDKMASQPDKQYIEIRNSVQEVLSVFEDEFQKILGVQEHS